MIYTFYMVFECFWSFSDYVWSIFDCAWSLFDYVLGVFDGFWLFLDILNNVWPFLHGLGMSWYSFAVSMTRTMMGYAFMLNYQQDIDDEDWHCIFDLGPVLNARGSTGSQGPKRRAGQATKCQDSGHSKLIMRDTVKKRTGASTRFRNRLFWHKFRWIIYLARVFQHGAPMKSKLSVETRWTWRILYYNIYIYMYIIYVQDCTEPVYSIILLLLLLLLLLLSLLSLLSLYIIIIVHYYHYFSLVSLLSLLSCFSIIATIILVFIIYTCV